MFKVNESLLIDTTTSELKRPRDNCKKRGGEMFSTANKRVKHS